MMSQLDHQSGTMEASEILDIDSWKRDMSAVTRALILEQRFRGAVHGEPGLTLREETRLNLVSGL